MAALKVTIVLLACMLAFAACAPAPGGWGGKHQHVVVHVPYNIHTVHHHHVEKIPYIKHVPIIKHVHVPVYKEVHVPVHVPVHSGWSNNGWSNGGGWW